jgi:hypothetical protein
MPMPAAGGPDAGMPSTGNGHAPQHGEIAVPAQREPAPEKVATDAE